MQNQSESQPKTAVLDGDIICYRAAFWADQDGIEGLPERITHDVQSWTPVGVDKVFIALSCSRKDNFRRNFWELYKAHRDVKRQTPESMEYSLELIHNFDVIEVPHLEADDIMGLSASSNKGIAVTIDKDLRSVPGWHWNPDKEPTPKHVDLWEADYNFHKQWLTGDTTDNIPGIWRYGPAKAEKLLKYTHPRNWTAAVVATYEQAKAKDGSKYGLEYCMQMARCVRILRDGEYCKQTNQPKLFELPNSWGYR